MTLFWQILRAEARKQHRNYFHSRTIYVSLFLWPLLSFLTAWYSFSPFPVDSVSGVPYLNSRNLVLFVLLGYMCMSFFRSLVQSAWTFSFERIYGTLELIYLSPASRLAVIAGNAVSSLFESVWVMAVFFISVMILRFGDFRINPAAAAVVTLLMVMMAVFWGMLLNSLFLFSRDSGFLFTVLEEPMETFAGVRVPVSMYPGWARAVSMLFPLSWAVEAMRRVFLNGEGLWELRGFVAVSLGISLLMLAGVLAALRAGEAHARKTGNLALF